MYLYDVRAPARIHACAPGMKLIAVLRDPVERAHSSYLHLVRDGRETSKTFEAALEREDERVRADSEAPLALHPVGVL